MVGRGRGLAMSQPAGYPDPDLQQRQAADPAKCVWLAASAGSGKTKVLTDRVLTLLLGDTPPGHILCLTFTKAAAAEMANRVTERLADWATVDSAALAKILGDLLGRAPEESETERARRLFAEVLDVPGGLKIQTIHSFCESLIARFPFESGIPPHFDIMDERSVAELMIRARDRMLAGASTESSLTEALAVLTRHVQEDRFAGLIASMSQERGRLHRGLVAKGGLQPAIANIYRKFEVESDDTVDDVRASAVADDAIDKSALTQAAAALSQGTEKTDQPRGQLLSNWLESDLSGRLERFDDYIALYLTQSGECRKRLITAGALKADPGAEEILEREAARLIAVQEHLRAVVTAESSAALLRLGAALLDEYDLIKRRMVWLDYDDLIYMARDLLSRPGIAPWVLFKLDGGLDHILIDEAQDTNPEQWQIVAALADEFFAGESARPELRTLFAVGDVKQSIFSFQRAEPALFERYRQEFRAQAKAVERQWGDLDLSVSFRSTDAVLAAVDAVFARTPAKDGVIEGDQILKHHPYRSGAAGLVELWPAVGPEPADPLPAWTPPVERIADDNPSRRLAELIAAKIAGWIGNEILPSHGRPLRAGDFMILLRRRSGFMAEIVAALKAKNVAVAGVDRMMLTEQLAVMDLMALGRFLLLPEDDLTLAVILKSPLFGFDEEQLFRLAYDRGADSLWRRLTQLRNDDPAFASAGAWLESLLARTGFERPYELFASVLAAPVPAEGTGREAMIRRLGPECEDPIDEFLNLAMSHERTHIPSLEGFLHWMEAGAVEIKRDLEQGSADEVRVMTVHGAKGLQAPVVFLPDTMAKPTASPEILWQDALPLWSPRRQFEPSLSRGLRAEAEARRDQEYRRLLYVAMTRAEDRLYICGHHGAQKPADDCWYALMREGLGEVANPMEFKFSAEISRGWQGEGLQLETAQRADVDAREPISSAADTVPLPDWVDFDAPAEATPPKPLAPSRPGDDPPVASPLGVDRGERFKRGLLIHRLLQTLPDLEPAARRNAAERMLDRKGIGLVPEERENIVATVFRVLDDPEFADLFGPNSKAEVPLVGTVDMAHGLEVVSGQVDRLLVRDEEVLVVDYKSLRPPPDRENDVPTPYIRQMAAYRALLQGVWPDRSVKCALLWTENPSLMLLEDALLDSYSTAP